MQALCAISEKWDNIEKSINIKRVVWIMMMKVHKSCEEHKRHDSKLHECDGDERKTIVWFDDR